jgi:hypothetical protein
MLPFDEAKPLSTQRAEPDGDGLLSKTNEGYVSFSANGQIIRKEADDSTHFRSTNFGASVVTI